MTDKTTAKAPDLDARSPDRKRVDAREPDMPPAAGPHSPGSAEPKKASPEAGGYERHPTDRSTNNAKGGYGAG